MSMELYKKMYDIYRRFPLSISSIEEYCNPKTYSTDVRRARGLGVAPRYYEVRLKMHQEKIDELKRYKKALEEFISNVAP